MSYDPKYREWVEKHEQAQENEGLSEPYELYHVYRGVPVLRVKVKDNPPQYRFRAPIVKNRTRDIDRLHKRIDKRLDEIPSSGSRDKTSKKDVDNQDSDEGSYFQRWQDCQIELVDLKRREGSMLSKMKELQVKVDELSSALLRLQKEATDLRSKLKASETMISDLNKKK